MKNLFTNKKFLSIFALSVVLIGVLIWFAIPKTEPVNLDRNSGLTSDANIVDIMVEPLITRSVSVEGNSKTVLGDISKLYIYDPKNHYNGRDFIAFEYQDKDVTPLITISPDLRGTWSTRGGKQLVFTPEKDWLPNQKFTITVNKDLISPELKLKNNKLSFTTPGNDVKIENLTAEVARHNAFAQRLPVVEERVK